MFTWYRVERLEVQGCRLLGSGEEELEGLGFLSLHSLFVSFRGPVDVFSAGGWEAGCWMPCPRKFHA